MNIIDKYLDYFDKCTYTSKEILFREGDTCTKVGYILSGSIKIYTITPSSKEETINTLSKGEFFGDNLIFSDYNYYMGIGETLSSTTILWISRSKLLSLMQYPDFTTAYLNNICTKELNLRIKNLVLSHKKISDRILFYLTFFAKLQNTTTIHYKSITDLARTLGLPRPSLSRELTHLEHEGYITKRPKAIYLSPRLIEEYR